MKITSPYFLALLAIVLYAVSMLVYGTLCIFKNATANDISAFGSILGGVGAFFGGFVALIIFYGWKRQHNKSIVANEAKLAFNKIHNERSIIHGLKFKLNNLSDIYESDRAYYIRDFLTEIIKLQEERNKNLSSLDEFIYLVEGSKLHRLILEYSLHLESFQKIKIRDLGVSQTVFDDLKDFLENGKNHNRNILEELKTYIFA
ncbi:hypothetical protein P7L54_14150 [Acinetobacter bereziniae]|uniref:Uncharacterized protein n=1 Tax=Acinetobacter bereziniae LMG 1003 = CIP 70.12 TaxID=981324 RepID=N9ETC1_ACIBZ|nr:hypothetical protein [Acinetobacter bereziniae]ENV98134.1 hypothetical protein F938_01193 [Acinetobacter bereziniae LMG 1003 = CIP 70.12]MDG3557089.1 hypothetical protein [Acinetobacter bereziniae]QQC81772.1 hypothetical protein I9192_06795 [Acinetobacter bereziniae]UUN94887.1 hypothetical protein I9189_006830 [Acinetobacter bereziniae]